MVSIIMPIYNRAHLIIETLNSIKKQTYQNWECLIIDDGSTDNTSEVVINYAAQDTRFKFYTRPETSVKGPSSCRNYLK